MLDFQSLAAPMAHWKEVLTRSAVLLFALPVAEPDGVDPKRRPCLLLDVIRRSGRDFALLAYGTTARSKANRGYEIHVRREDELAAAGLNRPTRYVGARRIEVALDHPGFTSQSGQASPVLGHLSGSAVTRMNAVPAGIEAERDIAVEYRYRRKGAVK